MPRGPAWRPRVTNIANLSQHVESPMVFDGFFKGPGHSGLEVLFQKPYCFRCFFSRARSSPGSGGPISKNVPFLCFSPGPGDPISKNVLFLCFSPGPGGSISKNVLFFVCFFFSPEHYEAYHYEVAT